MDFSTVEAINGFWRHTPYNEVTKLPAEALLSGETVTSWHADYVFAGWYLNPEFTGEPVTVIPENIEANLTLYAKWEEEVVLPSIDEVRDLAVDTDVEFVGVVTGFTDYSTANSNYDKVFVEDSTGAIVVYRAAFPVDLKIGDKFLIVGKLGQYNGLIQIAQGATVTLIDSDNDLILPVEVTNVAEINEDFQAKRIDLEGTVVSVTSNGQTMVVKVGETNITIRSNSNSANHTVNSHLLTATVGQVVKLHGIHVDWFNGSQLIPTLVEQVEFVMPSDEELAQLVLDAIVNEWENKSFNMGTDATLPQTGDHDSTITWTFASEGIIVEGKWSDVTADTTYSVTVVVTIGDEEVSKVFDITVKFVDDVPPVGGSFVETFDDSNATGSYADGTFTGVNGVVWNYVHARDEEATPIDGKGIMLRRSDEPSSLSATFTNGIGEFSFEYRKAFTGGTARKYAVEVTHNGNTTTYDLPEFGSGSGAQETIYEFTQALNLTGTVTINIYATGAKGNQQAVFDNFAWTEFPE